MILSDINNPYNLPEISKACAVSSNVDTLVVKCSCLSRLVLHLFDAFDVNLTSGVANHTALPNA